MEEEEKTQKNILKQPSIQIILEGQSPAWYFNKQEIEDFFGIDY